MSGQSVEGASPDAAVPAVVGWIRWLQHNALSALLVLLIVPVVLPWLAPLFMKLGWETAGHLVYRVYSYLCHQLPQRSFFFFGPQASYSLEQLQEAGVNIHNVLDLRSFVGNAALGYKVAWSDRMVSLYSSIPIVGLALQSVRKRAPRLSFWGFAILALPMVLDGASHFVSDLAGIGQGFRTANEWLVSLTGGIFPESFYAGTVLGSFNSWMRLITGALFGVGVMWFSFPALEASLAKRPAMTGRDLPEEGIRT